MLHIFLKYSEGVWAAFRSEGFWGGRRLSGCAVAWTVSGPVVSAASGVVERVTAAGLKPLQGQPARRGRPWRHEQWLWGKWVLLLFHILPGLSITLDFSMPRSSSLCSKCIPQLGGNDCLLRSPSPHSCTVGVSPPLPVSWDSLARLLPLFRRFITPFSVSGLLGFHYFQYPSVPAPYVSFLRALCSPLSVWEPPLPISHIGVFVLRGAGG